MVDNILLIIIYSGRAVNLCVLKIHFVVELTVTVKAKRFNALVVTASNMKL